MRYSFGPLLVSCLFVHQASAQDDAASQPALRPSIVTQPSVAGGSTVIYSDLVTSPTSEVPGFPGFRFELFDRPALSPNGLHWILSANTDHPTIEDDVLLVNGVVVLRENDSPAYIDPGDTVNLIDQVQAINDAGEYCFSFDTDVVLALDEFIVKGDGLGGFTVIAREGSQVDGAPLGWLNGFLNSPVITNAGAVGYESDSVDNTPGGIADDNVIMLGTTVLIQKGVTVPTGQAGGGTFAWEDFDFEDFWTSADGVHYLLQGDLNSGEFLLDDIVVVDGAVVLQEGSPIPGGPADVIDQNGLLSVFMSHSGDWMADGDFDVTDQDWVVYNGNIVALEGGPIHVGTTEAFGTGSFFVSTCNGVGDYLVGGTTDAADTTRNAVIVLNNERVIVREGDPIDVDGNGIFDDDVFFNFFGTDDFRLTDDLKLYFVSTVRNSSSTTSIGDVFVMMDLAGGVGSPICVSLPNSTGFPSYISGAGSNVVSANNLTLEVCGLPVGTFGFFVTSEDAILVPMPGGSAGNLCIASFVIGRYSFATQVADAAGRVSQVIDLTMVPEPASFTAVLPGDTRYWQYWHRDVDGMGMPTSNFSDAICVTFE